MNCVKIINSKEFNFSYYQENEQYNNKKGVLRGFHYQVEL